MGALADWCAAASRRNSESPKNVCLVTKTSLFPKYKEGVTMR